ncbi:MAG: four helix bundle protein [Terriglobales bacterium]
MKNEEVRMKNGGQKMVGSRGDDLKVRTKQFSLRIIRLCEALPAKAAGRVISSQLLRSATSVGANYRSAFRARSQSEFVAKIGIVLEEADETVYWLELIVESGLLPQKKLDSLLAEANELVAIFAASKLTASGKRDNPGA